ncbi:MAG: minichromosome maintenance protein MCM [Candidatus Thorarchaeota archaeon]|nr:MAG: minichromosome maintenance protein MCM [Candidatus Thorarchaeota archaeon]
MSIPDDGLQERFEEFLRTFKDEQGNLTYWPRIQQLSLNAETSLTVDFQDLTTFDNVFVVEVADQPSSFLELTNRALISVLRIEDPDYVASFADPSGIFKVRIINVPDHVPLRAVRSKHIGKIIQISGIMMRASEVKPLLVVGVFKCRGNAGQCPNEHIVHQEDGKYTIPEFCDQCGQKRPPTRLIPEKSLFIDWQKVRIQESPEELPPGQMPRSIDVTLRGDIVDISRPGDMVKISGILQTTPDFSRRGGRLATFNIFIDANGVEVAEKEYEQLEISEEDTKRIKELAEDQYVHERIFASIAPSIQGHEKIKESIALLLFGGVGKTLPDGTRLRGRSNILMVGDPGTGKSQILKFVSGLASRGLYTSGKGTTAAGLTAAVVHDTDSGAMTLEAGALVLADQGIACIDEFDKMDPNDRTAIHEAMEQHTVSIAKAGIVATLNARTSILAAANPSLGRYESSLSVQDNIRLPFTILSRFDLIWIMVDTVEATKDRELAKFILGMHRRQPMQSATTPTISSEFLKKYIGYANRYVIPQLSAEASEVIENFYVDLRKTAEGGVAPVPITARQLESLVRLAEARARMALRSKVTKEDAQASVRLMEESLRMVALDRITGKIDIDQLVSKMSAAQRSSSDKVLTAMKNLEEEGTSVVSEDVLIQRVVEMGVPREAAEAVIRKLVTEGILFNPQEGKVKRA